MVDDLNYDDLDPGVRELVRLLRGSFFRTTDSGDGVSKPPDARVLDYPHVFVATEARDLVGECDRMRRVLAAANVTGFRIQGTYDPDDMTAVIAVLGDPQQGDP